jgi:hypothetical protein
VNCVTNAECTDEDAPFCDTGIHYCRQCLTNDHCPAERPVCDLSGYYCTGCSSDADCTAALPACTESQICTECTPDNTTLCTGETPHCDEQNTCVECADNSHCDEAAGELCDLNTKTCGTGNGDGGGSGDGGANATGDERYGACAGCVTAGTRTGQWQLGILAAALALLMRRRSRSF